MKKIKSLITSVSFYVGVNIIGLPLIHTHNLLKTFISKSLFHK